ncbi:DUF5915 domain-containing protein, partial [Acinetobacter baumannii]
GVADGSTQVLLDVRITEELEREGMAREIVRNVQELRKTSKLEPEDRIELHLSTDSLKLAQAIQEHKQYISDETLTIRWATE